MQASRRVVTTLQVVPSVKSAVCLHCNKDERGQLHCRYVDTHFDGPRLMPSEQHPCDIAEQAMRLCDQVVSKGMHLVSAKGARHWGIGTNATPHQKEAFQACCRQWAQLIDQSGGPYVAGQDVSIPDLVLWPFMERFILCAELFSDHDVAQLPQIRQWVDAMQQRESVRFAAADLQAHRAVLQRERCLDWFDFVASGPTQLHPQLQPYMSKSEGVQR